MTQGRRPSGHAVCPDETELGIGAHKSQPNVNQLDEIGEHAKKYSH